MSVRGLIRLLDASKATWPRRRLAESLKFARGLRDRSQTTENCQVRSLRPGKLGTADAIARVFPHCGRLNVDREINFRNTLCIYISRPGRGNEISGICAGLLAKFRTLAAAARALRPFTVHANAGATKRAAGRFPEVRPAVIIIFQVRALSYICMCAYTRC